MHLTPTEVVARLCASEVVGMERCGGGGNNQVYRAQTVERVVAAKFYGSAELEVRDRLGHEFDGLRFLKQWGIGRALPAALAVDRDARCAVYEWIDGEVPTQHGLSEIRALLALTADLHAARHGAGAAGLPLATEAVLRSTDLIEQVERRYARLTTVAGADAELARFLGSELRPEIDRCTARLTGPAERSELTPTQRTLSPSDFGLHNALRRSDGSLTFIDFEYFGWDDPVKLTADLLWHPAMQLSAAQRRALFDGVHCLYGDDNDFGKRLATYYPMFGIRWTLIMLNEFVPELWARRAYAGKGGDWTSAKRKQLRKARAKLAAVRAYREGHIIP